MTETVCLVMPAATLAGPAGSRTTRRPALDRNRAAAWIAIAETRLRRIEAQARGRADARGLASDAAIVARARFLVSESGGTLNVIEAVNRARAEAGAERPARLAGALEAVAGAADRLDAGIAAAMEAQLLDWTRQAIAAARRKLEDGLPLDAGESALDAREALVAVEQLRSGKPHLAKRLLHERVAPPRA